MLHFWLICMCTESQCHFYIYIIPGFHGKIHPNNIKEGGVSWLFSSNGETFTYLDCNSMSTFCGNNLSIGKDNSLNIKDTDTSHIGMYTCIAEALSGTVSKSNTNYFPAMKAFPGQNYYHYTPGRDLRLDCIFQVIQCILEISQCTILLQIFIRTRLHYHYHVRFILHFRSIQRCRGGKNAR